MPVSEYTKKMRSLAKSDQAEAGLMAGMTGMLLSDIIPTPADAFYFWAEDEINRRQDAKEITPKQFWALKVANYYLPNAIWWAGVGLLAIKLGRNFDETLKIAVAVTGAGAVGAVFYQMYQREGKWVSW